MTSYSELEKIIRSVNKHISIKGKISEIPWQHLVYSDPEYPHFEYFDLEDDYQIIIYTKQKITNQESILVYGKVIPVTGRPKRSNPESDEKFTEYHILVDKWDLINV
ncbi:MAG: hypothetical protein HeimC3_07210 [Candidatus Heimdallarchaeota archaeon LC_3]|nr:MAG: hypothetical protein HeimC3_07210 [Candidatus Heimdallarchaeota archaeon LC_3]